MIKIYTTKNCEYCKRAKDFFDSRKIAYEEVNLSKGGVAETIKTKKFFNEIGLKKFPVIIFDGDALNLGLNGWK